MSLREALRIAFRGVRANRMRSALTMLSIIIGVAAVILLVAIGNGVQASVNARFAPLATLITVVPSSGNVPGGVQRDLIDADIIALRNSERTPNIAAVVPAVNGDALTETETIKFRSRVVGSTELSFAVTNRALQAGSFFDESQVRSAAKVVVFGSTVAETLFGSPDAALGQAIRINHRTYKVIGVMTSIGLPNDNDVVMPLDTARRFVFGGGNKINQIVVQAAGVNAVPSAEDEVINVLSDRHRIKDPTKRDFEVQSVRGRLDTFNQALRMLTLFTATVAAISLVVGGIGVMNVMLVSVTERTREIGIRKAIGASRRVIVEQFLIESLVLAGLGGLIGVMTGIGLSMSAAAAAPFLGPTFTSFIPVVSTPSVAISFAISLAIGLAAGGYPAYRAARLRPIEALRYQ